MPQCVVIADDLTGANSTGVLLVKANLRAYTIIEEECLSINELGDCDCAIYSTDSRGVESGTAYKRVFDAASILKSPEVKLYSKRIDSTLRGNLGSETDAMLDALDNGAVAIAVPCFPSSNRITVGGYLLVNALPLQKTEAAADPKNPMTTPLCAEIFRRQSKYPVGSITLREQMEGQDYIAACISQLAEQGVRTIIFDAVTEEDIEQIADAVIKSGIPFIAVDPGAFTATVARKMIAPAQTRKSSRILVAIGSVNVVASRQLDFLLSSQNVLNVYMDTVEFLESTERRNAEIDRVASEIIDKCDDYEVCSIAVKGIIPQYRVPFEPYSQRDNCTFDELSELINNAIAEIVRRIISSGKDFRGLYTCGGDVTVAVCRCLKSNRIRLLDEILPLAAYGELMGGEHSGLKIATKGGMTGDADAIVRCVQYMKEKLSI